MASLSVDTGRIVIRFKIVDRGWGGGEGIFRTLDLGHEELGLPNVILSTDGSPYSAAGAVFKVRKVTCRAKLDSLRTSHFDRIGVR